jgi:hypothetical protein
MAWRVKEGAGLVTAPNALYVTDGYNTGGEGVSRSINPTGKLTSAPYVFWDDLFETIEGPLQKPIMGLWKCPGSNTDLWTIYDGKKIMRHNDLLVKKVPLLSPSDGHHSGRVDQVTVEWDSLPTGEKYELKVNTRSDFKGSNVLYMETDGEVVTKATNWLVEIAEKFTGIPLYWRVRVYECWPYRSLYSETWSFTTELKGSEWNPFRTAEGFAGNVAPPPGATGVPLMPTFQWNSADWATGYEIQVALDDAFSSLVGSAKVTNSVWVMDVELKTLTVYFWRVRAFSDTSESEWAVGTFTTVGPPPPPPPAPPKPTPPVVIPPAPAPITPIFIWVIIAIGGVLAIAVIVLIVVTRKKTP